MIKHVLADGREVESIEGFVVPHTGATAAVYQIVAEVARNHLESANQKEDKTNAAV